MLTYGLHQQIVSLKNSLRNVALGKAFVLQGGKLDETGGVGSLTLLLTDFI